MAKLTDAQLRAASVYKERNKELDRYSSKKGTAKGFILDGQTPSAKGKLEAYKGEEYYKDLLDLKKLLDQRLKDKGLIE